MALVAPGEPADLRPPPRPGAVVRSVSPWQLMDAPTLRPSTPHEGQGTSTSRQSVGEALQELQRKFKDFSQEEKEARSVQEGELQKLRLDLGEEKATTECVAADVRALQNENTVLRGQLQQVAADVQGLRSALQAALDVGEALQELQSKFAAFSQQDKEARSIQEEELRKLRSDLSEEKANTDREKEARSIQEEELQKLRSDLGEEKAKTDRVAEQLSLKVLVPEFRTDTAIPGMEYSHGNRRCRYTGKVSEWFPAVAKEGFMSGRQQFTVLMGTRSLCIGVAVANALRAGREAYQQGVYLDFGGTIHTPNVHRRSYTTTEPFKAGSRVTMRLDFDKGTASYEVDGVDLGVVEGLTLPEGPLYPAVVFWGNGDDVAEFVPYAPAGPASLAATA